MEMFTRCQVGMNTGNWICRSGIQGTDLFVFGQHPSINVRKPVAGYDLQGNKYEYERGEVLVLRTGSLHCKGINAMWRQTQKQRPVR